MKRREFLQFGIAASGLSGLLAFSHGCEQSGKPKQNLEFTKRYRGFNLLEKFTDTRNAPFQESDFEIMADWGFNFARIPMSYWCWSGPEDWYQMDETVLKEIDQVVEFGRQYDIHVNLNLHRAPGYCVNPPGEPLDLWTNGDALDAAAFHWRHFAERYQGISSEQVSFDLLNEPPNITESLYVPVIKRLVQEIREVDPERIILADGLRWGREPVTGLTDLQIGQSTRGYDPMRISHYRASWVSASKNWSEPTWPLVLGPDNDWDKQRLREDIIEPWVQLEQQGTFVHVGEWGCYNKTPHRVALAWMEDFLQIWDVLKWGWALWNLRGSFGVLDSGREDVDYEEFKGHKLDRKMLELIKRY